MLRRRTVRLQHLLSRTRKFLPIPTTPTKGRKPGSGCAIHHWARRKSQTTSTQRKLLPRPGLKSLDPRKVRKNQRGLLWCILPRQPPAGSGALLTLRPAARLFSPDSQSMTLGRSRSFQYRRNSLEQNFEVQQQRPFVDVLEIEFHPLLERNRTAAA